VTTNTYTADRTALPIVDPYTDFMSEGGGKLGYKSRPAKSMSLYRLVGVMEIILGKPGRK
jgi:hypothetical protein